MKVNQPNQEGIEHFRGF